MKPDFFELIKQYNNHSVFLDLDGITDAMNICYEMGKNDGNKEVLEWLSKMDYLSDNIQYIKEEWENQVSYDK